MQPCRGCDPGSNPGRGANESSIRGVPVHYVIDPILNYSLYFFLHGLHLPEISPVHSRFLYDVVQTSPPEVQSKLGKSIASVCCCSPSLSLEQVLGTPPVSEGDRA